jgi:hypothetical protein
MTKDEALRLAWYALEDIGDEWGFTSQRTVPKRKEAITAIKEALANEALEKMAENARELGLDYEPAKEPVAIVDANDEGYWAEILPDRNVKVGQLLYTTPQRKPLTDEEIWEALGGIDCTRPMLIARAIEAAHGIKGQA